MKKDFTLNDITIRTELQSGDLGYVIYLHGKLYKEEYGYGLQFESYVAESLYEFYQQYDPKTSRVWICEHQGKIIGFLFLMNRKDAAQLRYFLIEPDYRGIGLGRKLMDLYMEFMKACNYKRSYLMTTHELFAASHLYRTYGFKLSDEKESDSFGKNLKEQRYDLVI
jgi:N-acetylglutamate synthase-like GNAT family acetyltransferase